MGKKRKKADDESELQGWSSEEAMLTKLLSRAKKKQCLEAKQLQLVTQLRVDSKTMNTYVEEVTKVAHQREAMLKETIQNLFDEVISLRPRQTPVEGNLKVVLGFQSQLQRDKFTPLLKNEILPSICSTRAYDVSTWLVGEPYPMGNLHPCPIELRLFFLEATSCRLPTFNDAWLREFSHYNMNGSKVLPVVVVLRSGKGIRTAFDVKAVQRGFPNDCASVAEVIYFQEGPRKLFAVVSPGTLGEHYVEEMIHLLESWFGLPPSPPAPPTAPIPQLTALPDPPSLLSTNGRVESEDLEDSGEGGDYRGSVESEDQSQAPQDVPHVNCFRQHCDHCCAALHGEGLCPRLQDRMRTLYINGGGGGLEDYVKLGTSETLSPSPQSRTGAMSESSASSSGEWWEPFRWCVLGR